MDPLPVRVEHQQQYQQVDDFLRESLLLDLEVSHQGKIHKIGAILDDRTLRASGELENADALATLAEMTASARCVLGHNLVSHDLAILKDRFPKHPLLNLPVIDTLLLSPLAFPENPYHRLIKDYKLVRESVNDPVADARQAAAVFADEYRSFAGLRQTEPQLFELLQFLLITPDGSSDPLAAGMTFFFDALGGSCPSADRALDLCRELVARWGCSAKPVEQSLFQTRDSRLAVAYALTWLRVSGSNSVLPPWVRLQHPSTMRLIESWRETPCDATGCRYCRTTFDAHQQLKRFFNWDTFRPVPSSAAGGSLQQEIVQAGLRNESLLAILPTGGGKSLCFQLPALARNFRRGVLTIVISPLQALMKDQVEGLMRRTGTPFAAALYGMLTSIERADVLQRVRMGDVAILYVSPEQLRNRSFVKAIEMREIGCWVFDEAHCLSKWGHDFRPDYLYAGRFIREFSSAHNVPIPPVVCVTATAKRDVKEEIITFFRTETGRELKHYEGGVERNNLRFAVQPVNTREKLEQVHHLLSDRLPHGADGVAIVFRATREDTESTCEFLRAKGWSADHFHAGPKPPEKKRIQEEFLAGGIQVICATNAFGMGIDKENVRMVIHGDTPGSLENYLQEAGRAGRDGEMAECILLYDEQDCEKQFRLGAFSELKRRDIAQILRTLRKAARGGDDEIVITAGEILRDEETQVGIDVQDRMADTKVRAAISWLERAGFVQRDDNVTSVFQARLLVRDLKEAEERMAPLNLSQNEKALWLAILRAFIAAGINSSLTVDDLALLPEFAAYAKGGPNSGNKVNPEYVSGKILKILGSMAQVGLMKRDLLLSAFVRHKVADHSQKRFERVTQLDRKLIDLLSTEEPDPEGWMPLSLRLINQRLSDDGAECSTEMIRQLLRSLSEDGRGFAAANGSIDLRFVMQDSYRVRVRRSWSDIAALADKRRRIASLILQVLFKKVPADAPATSELLVEFAFDELREAIEADLVLRSEIKDMDAALERALMFLHEQQVIILQQGLAIFRSAMTIKLQPHAKGERYKTSDYQPLEHHYRERVLQVHVMSEFARRGIQAIGEALRLVLAYFTLDKVEFLQTYFRSRLELLRYATTSRSFQQIVTDLNNPEQIKIVTAPTNRNMLILAGPGSGKTKTVVHRCAYLLRVERARPQSILVCCFNRSAAIELRRRLIDLVGEDARGVTVLTYHGLAVRLLGYSFAGRSGAEEIDFNELIQDAVKLLRGEKQLPGLEPDAVRNRLLAGFQHILVDEYQDIDLPQYEMISAIAGRTLDDPDQKLSILAVGDDDQNIYSFRHTNVAFIRRFQSDYKAEIHYLVENYRSTRYVIEAANQLIGANSNRMKTEHPIRIDRHREMLPAGGVFGQQDELTGGKVQVIRVTDAASQTASVLTEIKRLQQLGVADLTRIAVLSSQHRDLAQVRVKAEEERMPVRWISGIGGLPSLSQVREIRSFLQELKTMRSVPVRGSVLLQKAQALLQPDNPWCRFLCRIVEAWRDESGDAELPALEALEYLYESCSDSRRDYQFGEGVTLSTVHAAKGTEYDHVLLIGPWRLPANLTAQEETRRAFYVGMTRAKQTLSLVDRMDLRPSLPSALDGTVIVRRDFEMPETPSAPMVPLDYATLGMADIHLSYPSQFPAGHPVHAALASLVPGDRLRMRVESNGIALITDAGVPVARLSRKAAETWSSRLDLVREIRVVAMVHRTIDQETRRNERNQVEEWEVPVVELCYELTTAESK